MKKLLIFAWMACCGMALADDADSTHFGKVTVNINDTVSHGYIAKSAKLYRHVAIEYQNILQLQSATAKEQYFYSQLSRGNSYVLHLILESNSPQPPAALASAYDLYLDLGDTLSENMPFNNRDSSVFVYPKGTFPTSEYYASNQEGHFSIVDQGNLYGVKGIFSTAFDYPDPVTEGALNHFTLQGELSIPKENLLSGGETGLQSTRVQSGGVVRNLVIAGVLTAIIVAIALSPND